VTPVGHRRKRMLSTMTVVAASSHLMDDVCPAVGNESSSIAPWAPVGSMFPSSSFLNSELIPFDNAAAAAVAFAIGTCCTIFAFWLFVRRRYPKLLYHRFPPPSRTRRREELCTLQRKREFLAKAGENYGYRDSPGGFIDNWRPREFQGLIRPILQDECTDAKRSIEHEEEDDGIDVEPMVYLDYAGSSLPALSQLQDILARNATRVLANPHSTGPAAALTSELVQQAKKKVLDHFHANPGRLAGLGQRRSGENRRVKEEDKEAFHPGYEIVFTSGATEALRIVAERFPCCTGCEKCGNNKKSLLVYPQNSHTSVIGMRAAAPPATKFVCKPITDLLNDIGDTPIDDAEWSRNGTGCTNLLVLPLECNFGGDRYDLHHALQAAGDSPRWYSMLDLSKAASTGSINLCALNPDFACISFYKMFGEPTGLGCLFVKRSAVDTLRMASSRSHHYFGGGSVDAVLPMSDFAIMRTEPSPLASLSNGTVHFRGIAALLSGFRELDRVGGVGLIQKHSHCLAHELVQRLGRLVHGNGRRAIKIYGNWGKHADRFGSQPGIAIEESGPSVAFNVLRADGSFVGYNEVSKLAALNRPPIQLRVGCFCNPGACQLALSLTDDDVIRNYKETGHVCGDHIDIIRSKPTGTVRASFGKDSIWEDLDVFVLFIEKMFVQKVVTVDNAVLRGSHSNECRQPVTISELYLFPIKSCSAQRIRKWPMNPSSGRLLFDREFSLVDASGSAMRLQSHPKMAFIRPEIDDKMQILSIHAPGQESLEIFLDEEHQGEYCSGVIKVCGNRCGAKLWGSYETSEWFNRFLGVQCWLARHTTSGDDLGEKAKVSCQPGRHRQVAFANEQPLLLISEQAVNSLNQVLQRQKQASVTAIRFRPNIVVRSNSGPKNCSDSLEDNWLYFDLEHGGTKLRLEVVGPCARCSMVDIDPENGKRGKALRALSEFRRSNGQITFGVFLRCRELRARPFTDKPFVWIHEGDVILGTSRGTHV
jgi:molybdenum cofactor sulfurtransferase